MTRYKKHAHLIPECSRRCRLQSALREKTLLHIAHVFSGLSYKKFRMARDQKLKNLRRP